MDIKTMEENITEVSTPTKDDDDFTLEDMRALEDMHAKEASYDVKEDTFKDDFTLEDIRALEASYTDDSTDVILEEKEESTFWDQASNFLKEEAPQLTAGMVGASRGFTLAPPHPLTKAVGALGGATIGGMTGQATTEAYKTISDDPNKASGFEEAFMRSVEAGEEEAIAEMMGQAFFKVGSKVWQYGKTKLFTPTPSIELRLKQHRRFESYGGSLNVAQVVDNNILHTLAGIVRNAPIGKETLFELDIKNQKALNNWGNNLINNFSKMAKKEINEEGLARSVLSVLKDTDVLHRDISSLMYKQIDDVMKKAQVTRPVRYTSGAMREGYPTTMDVPQEAIETIVKEADYGKRLIGYEDIKDVVGAVGGKKPIYSSDELISPEIITDVLQPSKKINIKTSSQALHKEGDIIVEPATGKAIMRSTNKVVDMTILKDSFNKINEKYKHISDIGKGDAQGTLIDRIIKLPKYLSFEDAQSLRSNILAIQRNIGNEVGKTKAEAIVSQSVHDITGAMRKAIDVYGDGKTLKLYEKASEFYRLGKQTTNKRFVRNLFTLMDAEDLGAVGTALYKTNKPSDIRALKKILAYRSKLSPKGFSSKKIMGDVQGAWLREAFTSAKAEGSDFFDPKILNSILTNKNKNRVFEELFNKNQQKLIKKFIAASNTAFKHEDQGLAYLVKFAQANAAMQAPAKVMAGLKAVALGGGVSFFNPLAGVATTTAILTGPKALGKWMSNPARVRVLNTILNHDLTKPIKVGGKVARSIEAMITFYQDDYKFSYSDKMKAQEFLTSDIEKAQMRRLGF
jgi:hypothetical protein